MPAGESSSRDTDFDSLLMTHPADLRRCADASCDSSVVSDTDLDSTADEPSRPDLRRCQLRILSRIDTD
jgi:hypothetical protein